MVKKRWMILLSGLLTLFGSPVIFGQQTQQRVRLDIENLTVDSATNGIYYEQRLYRNPLISLVDLQPFLTSRGANELVPMYQGVPLARYRLSPVFQTRLISHRERRELARRLPFGPGRYKLDFRIQPEVIANFGFKLDPFQTKTSLLLQTQLYLTRGLVLNAGLVFPLANNYDNQPMIIHPAPVYLNQFLAINHQNFLSASAGYFYNNQYGVHVQYRLANLTKPWSVGLESSVTGLYYYPTSGVYYEPVKNVVLLADVAYRLKTRNVTLKLSGGQYLYGDRGGRLDFIRQFASVDVGLFAAKTTRGSTAGFNFAIPIPPGRIVQSQRFRLRSTEEFRWEYTYNGSGANVGYRVKAGIALDALLRQYHSGYLSQQLSNE